MISLPPQKVEETGDRKAWKKHQSARRTLRRRSSAGITKKTYDMVRASLPKDLVARFKAKCEADGIPQAQVIKSNRRLFGRRRITETDKRAASRKRLLFKYFSKLLKKC